MKKIALLLFMTVPWVALANAPCKAGTVHLKLDRQKIGNIQVQQVNSWKEQWRMDPKKTAQHEIFGGRAPSQAKSPDMIPVTFVKGDDRTQVYSYTFDKKTYEFTMKKPEWLLPYAGIYKIMMWVLTDVKTTCSK